jgi:alanyl aminopeptidase
MGSALDRMGKYPKPGESAAVSMVRPTLLGQLGDAGQDASVLAFADSLRVRYLQDSSSVDPSIVETAIFLSAMHGDRALFDEYRRRFENSRTPAERNLFLGGLGAFRDTALVAEALRYSTTGPLRPQERFYFPRILTIYEPNRDRVLEWVKSIYPTVAAFLPAHFAIRFAAYGGGCSAERLENARSFLLDPSRAVPGMSQELDKVGDRVHECLRLAEREGPAVAAYLKIFAMGQ